MPVIPTLKRVSFCPSGLQSQIGGAFEGRGSETEESLARRLARVDGDFSTPINRAIMI